MAQFRSLAILPLLTLIICGVQATPKIVCVTGGNGFIASELTKQLLGKGYHVRVSVRSLNRQEKYKHLVEMEATLPGTLEIVEGDLMTPGSYDECLLGAVFLFHTASPATGDWENDPFLEVIEPAVQGTRNVFASAAKAGVDRVIFTSSLFAVSSWIMPDDKINQPGAVLDESDWNQFVSDEHGANPDMKIMSYIVSKARAEKVVWAEAQRLLLDVVSINPVGVIGPVLGENSLEAGSVGTMRDVMMGVSGHADMNFLWCDTRDVAKAHIAAAETPTASGRYVLGHTHTTTTRELRDALEAKFDVSYDIDLKQIPRLALNNEKVISLIGPLIPMADTIVDTASSLISWGVGHFPGKDQEVQASREMEL